jgi:hypothetical protein
MQLKNVIAHDLNEMDIWSTHMLSFYVKGLGAKLYQMP